MLSAGSFTQGVGLRFLLQEVQQATGPRWSEGGRSGREWDEYDERMRGDGGQKREKQKNNKTKNDAESRKRRMTITRRKVSRSKG